uniref:ATP-dependent DNA helicase n=1 Tax=Lactuca sativa TaxID=4236 RepID=A0A9R1XQ10_LACSA|nr:hypothetical protein LSAT_V11C200068430 [Lactuca sativa]
MVVYQAVVTSNEMKKHSLIFVFGHGGTGKTFLWIVIISYFRSFGKVVLAVAASGVALLMLPCGRTTHSRRHLRKLLQHTLLIIWDEAPMSDQRCFECVDRSLRDNLDCDQKPFGSVSVLLGGDFRQTLLVKSKSTREAIVSSTLPHCYQWKSFHNMRLMNAPGNPGTQFSTSDFAEWILKVGNGTIGEPDKQDPMNTFWTN